MFTARITAGNSSPWPTRVARITQKARNTIRSRSGKGAPPSMVSGMASAAARDTEPRMLDQATSVVSLAGWCTSSPASRPRTRRGR